MKVILAIACLIILFGNARAQEDLVFPGLTTTGNALTCKCVDGKKSKMNYNFALSRDSTIEFKGKRFVFVKSNAFREGTFIRAEGNKIFLYSIERTGWKNLKNNVSLLFDFGATPGIQWKMADSTSHKDKKLSLTRTMFNTVNEDSVSHFKLDFVVNFSDSDYLSGYMASKKFGLVGLEFSYDGKPSIICYEKRYKKLLLSGK